MTKAERQKILDYISDNRYYTGGENKAINADKLFEFIESLSTDVDVVQQRDNLIDHVKQMLPYIKEYDYDNYTDEGVGIFQDKKLTWLAQYTPTFISNIENGLTQ